MLKELLAWTPAFHSWFSNHVQFIIQPISPHKNVQGGPKNLAPFFLYALTLPNINRFSKLFHCQNQEKIFNNTITKDPTTPQVYRKNGANFFVPPCTLTSLTLHDLTAAFFCMHDTFLVPTGLSFFTIMPENVPCVCMKTRWYEWLRQKSS